MMGALKTKMEEQLELSEDGRLQKESTNKVRRIMEENKITERQEEAEEWELAKEFHEVLTSQNTLYGSGCLGWSNANICNEIEKGQMEEYKKKERQKEPWIFPPREIDISILRAKQDRYLRRRFRRDCQRDHLMLSTMPKLIDIEIEPTEITEEQLGRQLFISEEQLGRQLFWDPFEEKMGIRSILFQGGQSRRKLFERTIKTTLIEMMGKWKQREGNAVVEDDAIMEREKQTDVTEKLSGEFDDEEKEKRELEQLLRCKVCLDSDACVVLFPCRHMATCEYCEGFLERCPVCRSFIDEAVKVNEEN